MHIRILFSSFAVLVGLSLLMPGPARSAAVELRVTGVIKPAACRPSFGAGGNRIDFGDIAPATLKKGGPTPLAAREISFTIDCDADMNVALRFTDAQSASRVTALQNKFESRVVPEYLMGLGKAGAANIGAYTIALKQGSVTANNAAADTIASTDPRPSTATWHYAPTGYFRSGDGWLTWSRPGTLTPVAASRIVGMLSVSAVIDNADNLDRRSEILINGKGTIELLYF